MVEPFLLQAFFLSRPYFLNRFIGCERVERRGGMGIRNSRRSKSVKSVGEDANLRDLKLPTTNFIRKIKLVLRVYRIGLVPPALPIFHAQLSSKLSPSPRRQTDSLCVLFQFGLESLEQTIDISIQEFARIYILINISGKRGGNLQFKCNW